MTRRARPAPSIAPAFGDLATCPGKTVFFDKRSAKRRVAQIRQDGGAALRTYRCSACGNWHLGHPAGRATGTRHADLIYRAPTPKDLA